MNKLDDDVADHLHPGKLIKLTDGPVYLTSQDPAKTNQVEPINLTASWTTPDDLIREDLHGLRIHYDGRLLRLSEKEIDEIMGIIAKHKSQISHEAYDCDIEGCQIHGLVQNKSTKRGKLTS